MMPVQVESAVDLSVFREFLGQADYSEQAVCKRLGLRGLHEYLSRDEKSDSRPLPEVSDALDVLVQLFLAGNSVSREELGNFIPSAVRRAMEAMGILCLDSEQYYSPVALYPIQDLYIAPDRWKSRDDSPKSKAYVFPAIHPLTHDFLNLLPQSPCDKFLDLCSGTADIALQASKRYTFRTAPHHA